MAMIEPVLPVSPLRAEESSVAKTGVTGGRGARIDVLGCLVDVLDMKQSVDRCLRLVDDRAGAQHVVVNAAKLVEYRRDARMASIIDSCAIVNADGQAVVWAARALGRPLPERVAGIDLMHELLAAAAERGLGVYFLGARQEVLALAIERLRERHPGLRVVGSRNGYFDASEDAVIAAEVRSAAPDILFVAMSSPKKEYWLAENRERIDVPLAMGVGGAIDVVAGITERAPVWMQKAGLEWFFRLLQEPGRMWKRYLRTNTAFIGMLVKQIASERRAGRAR